MSIKHYSARISVVEIKAGYSDTLGTIFIGGVANPSETLNNADRILEVELVDGLSSYDAIGTMSISGVVTGDKILSELQKQMGIESSIITEKASALLRTAKYSNGYCSVGKRKAALQSLMEKAGVNYSFCKKRRFTGVLPRRSHNNQSI